MIAMFIETTMKLFSHILIIGGLILILQCDSRATENSSRGAGANRGFVYAQVCDVSGNLYVATGGQGIFLNNADGWRSINNGLATTSVYSLAIDQRAILYAGTDAGLYAFSNNLWKHVTDEPVGQSVVGLVVGRGGVVVGVTSEKNLFRLRSDEKTTERIYLPGKGEAVAVVTSSSGAIFVGTADGEVYRSDDDGGSWVNVSRTPLNYGLSSLLIDRNGNIVAGTRGGGVFKLENEGWKRASTGLSSGVIYALAQEEEFLFAGTDDGVYVLSNRNDQWTKFSDMLTKIPVLSLALRGNKKVYAGTSGFGVVEIR